MKEELLKYFLVSAISLAALVALSPSAGMADDGHMKLSPRIFSSYVFEARGLVIF